jgi:hypothetical protein
VGHALDVAEAHRHRGLRPLERLDLALLVDAEHERVVGRVEVEPAMSRTFSTNSGSVESVKLFVRCGCTPKSAK